MHGTRSSPIEPAVTQPKDPSLGADTQLTTGYIPWARKGGGGIGEGKRGGASTAGAKGQRFSGRARPGCPVGEVTTAPSVRKERHGPGV